MEYRWKVGKDRSIPSGVNDVQEWAICGENAINELDGRAYDIDNLELKLVYLFGQPGCAVMALVTVT
eukprot:10950734-Ditylum_brightwellii.AAC.1